MRHVILALALLLALVGAARADTGRDPVELARTWRAAWVFAPSAARVGYQRLTTAALRGFLARQAHPLTAVVYAHACDGLTAHAATEGEFLAEAGYLVVEPDSFARRIKPKSCDPAAQLGGLHRAVLGWRQAELRYAVAQLAHMPNLLPGGPVLMGQSEGAIAVATITGVPSRARVIEGWTCLSRWPEYRGLRAPLREPVLSLVAVEDPWFESPSVSGDCGAFMANRPNSRSMVFGPPSYLSDHHFLGGDIDVQQIILAFLSTALGT